MKNDLHRIQVRDWYYFQPSAKVLPHVAEKVARDLAALFPHHRYLVSFEAKNKVITEGSIIKRAYVYLGDVLVRRMPDLGEPVVSFFTGG